MASLYKRLALPITLGSAIAASAITTSYFLGRELGKSMGRSYNQEASIQTRDKELEGKVYTYINGEYFLCEGRDGISLRELEKRTMKKLEDAYQAKDSTSVDEFSKKSSEINAGYARIRERTEKDARDTWGLETPEPVVKPEPKKIRTNLYETILGLERDYDSVIKSHKPKKTESAPKKEVQEKKEEKPDTAKNLQLVRTTLYETIFGRNY